MTGRVDQLESDKNGEIPQLTPKLLNLLGLTEDDWLKTLNRFPHHHHHHHHHDAGIIGHWHTLRELKEKLNQQWIKSARAVKNLYPSPCR